MSKVSSVRLITHFAKSICLCSGPFCTFVGFRAKEKADFDVEISICEHPLKQGVPVFLFVWCLWITLSLNGYKRDKRDTFFNVPSCFHHSCFDWWEVSIAFIGVKYGMVFGPGC